MSPIWFRSRGYKHFDRQVNEAWASKITNPDFVSKHSFSPLIKYIKSTKRYRRDVGKTMPKPRPIMYASHRDACILSYYSFLLNEKLELFFAANGIGENVIAYRAIGRSNYHFASDAFRFATNNSPVKILAFDVKGFFDNLDHRRLKEKLKGVFGVSSLSDDWYAVFRFITNFHYVELEKLKSIEPFSSRIKENSSDPIASISELKQAGIEFRANATQGKGIPQGTPISAAMSNLYMIDFDVRLRAACDARSAYYRRYSDDILIICKEKFSDELKKFVEGEMSRELLTLSHEKTEESIFEVASPASGRVPQYLGFSFHPTGAFIRSSSLSRQWRKLKRAVRRIKAQGENAITEGRAAKVFTKRLRKRFTPLQFRNFSSYARRSASNFGNPDKILRQVRRFERRAKEMIDDLNK